MNKDQEVKAATIFYSVITVLFFGLVFLSVMIYGFESDNKLVRKMENVIPFPIAIVSQTHWISVGEFYENIQSIRRFYENQDFSKLGIRIDFTTADGQKRLKISERQILTKMVEDEAIQLLAEKEGITVGDQELTDNVDRKLDEMGNGKAVKEQLMRLYGWTIDDFKEKVVRSSLYREKLGEVFVSKYQNTTEAKSKIESAQEEIIKKEKSFSDIVVEFSDGSSSQSGGELGWFKKEQIIPEIADQIFSLKIGDRSAILESSLGFHIVELEERKTEETTELIRIRQIFVAKKTFADWVEEEIKKMDIWIPLRGYKWDKESARVEFNSKDLIDFEQQLMIDPKGDISVMF